MKMKKERVGTKLLIKPEGRIDTNTAPEFGKGIMDELHGVVELTIDFSDVEYISSIGLRVILELQKKMNEQGWMKVINVTPVVKEVFDMTGFSNILKIE